MSSTVWRTISALGLCTVVGLAAAAAPVQAGLFTIVGGEPEIHNGIDTPCSPCRDGAGLPVGTQGYVGQNAGSTTIIPMTLQAAPGTIVMFNPLGSDANFHNQFGVTENGVDRVIFDYDNDPLTSVMQSSLSYTVPTDGIVHFFFRYDVGGANARVAGDPSNTFGIFLACLPQPNQSNPRMCDDGYIGFADGNVFTANDDHQDGGVGFSTIPEPSTWVLMGTGFLGLLGYGWRRKRQAA